MEQGKEINTDLYINNIYVPDFEEIEKHFKDHLFTFEKDRAPSQTSIKTQDWLFSKILEVRRSGLLHCQFESNGFLVWSMLKAKVSSLAHPSVNALKTSLLREWAKIPQETCMPQLLISDNQ